jgi:hypothetical protein
MRDESNRSHSLPKTAASLSRQAYWIASNLQKNTGGKPMSMRMQTAVRETLRDFVVVSSFCFWAVMIGFVPVFVIRVLIA